ncbi:Rossmann-like and DUF2520 domain-containing protein [Rhodoferax sp.]|uniref:Rossmann-like and DUF2520 domain-containing protein n=1 Tax=Rhodoferax sp. TaxID=50421 RepID=UPI00374DDCAD
MTLKTLNLVGSGRVGQTLARLWHGHGSFVVQDVLTTSEASAQAACAVIGAGTPVAQLQAMRAADVWMVATPDAVIAGVARTLAAAGLAPATVFHCSGALGSVELASLAAQGWQTASAHCILSFAAVDAAVQQFPGTACALEGNADACEWLRAAFSDIGAQCFAVASEHKLLYHAAAVFATNFLPVLQSVAEAAWQSSGVPDALIPGLRATLLQNAVANITRLGPAAALTGPAARGDTAAIARQALAVQAWDPQAGAAYEALSALGLRLAAQRGV